MEQKSIQNFLSVSEISPFLNQITPQALYKLLKVKNIESYLINKRKRVISPAGIRKIFIDKGFKYKQQVVAFDMIKGGVGKTTISATLGVRASHYGARVLLIDFDLQGNLSRSFDLPQNEFPVWIDVIRGEKSIHDCVLNVDEFLDIIPSNLNNSRLDIEISSSNINIKDVVADLLQPIKNNYDLIIIDCPPAINKVSASAICASNFVVIPVNPDPYSMDGLDMTINEINRLKKGFKVSGLDYRIVWNKYDARKRLGALYMHNIAKDIPSDKILPVVIRVDSTYENAIANAMSIFDVKKNNTAKEDIDQLAKEILGINEWVEAK